MPFPRRTSSDILSRSSLKSANGGQRVRVYCQADLCYDRGITTQEGASMGMKNKQLAKEIAERRMGMIAPPVGVLSSPEEYYEKRREISIAYEVSTRTIQRYVDAYNRLPRKLPRTTVAPLSECINLNPL